MFQSYLPFHFTLKLRFPCFFVPSLDRFLRHQRDTGERSSLKTGLRPLSQFGSGKELKGSNLFREKKPRKSDNKVLLVLMGLLFWDFQTVCAQNVSPCFSEKMGRKTEGMTDRRAQSFHLSISQIIIGLQSSKKVTKFANQTLL